MSKRFHMVGIGGIGMGTIASLLLAQGHDVSGSDVKENQVTQRLRKEGASIMIGHQSDNVGGVDCLIYSSAVREDNPEIMAAIVKGIPILKRAEILARLMNAQTGITVAGAHGKTTTSSMISHMLIYAGLDPTTAIGGITTGSQYNANLGAGKYFVAEVDESDGSFLFFNPTYSVITNIDFEHIDYYQSWENIMRAYTRFVKQTHPEGCLVVFGEDPRLRKLILETKARVRTYGFGKENDFHAEQIALDGYFTSFECFYKGALLGTVALQVPGEHNVLNALACIAIGRAVGIDFEVIKSGLREFSGVQRRFQLKGQVHDIMIVDDYGHHPTEIKAVLASAKSFKRNRIVTIFQPHRFSRTKFLMEEFVEAFKDTDLLILTDIYAASEEPIEGVSSQVLFERIKQLGRPEVLYMKKEDIVSHLINTVRPGDLVITLGAGDITKLSDELVAVLTPAVRK